MSSNYIDGLLANYCRSLKDYTEAVVRQADEDDVEGLTRAVLTAGAVFDDEMFARFGVNAPVEREWPDESGEPEDVEVCDNEVMVARVRFLSRGSFTDAVLHALDAHAQGWVAIAGNLGVEIDQFDVRVEPADEDNWDE